MRGTEPSRHCPDHPLFTDEETELPDLPLVHSWWVEEPEAHVHPLPKVWLLGSFLVDGTPKQKPEGRSQMLRSFWGQPEGSLLSSPPTREKGTLRLISFYP